MSRPEIKRRVRCAIYTRKFSEERLELAFNSLDAQREACAAYIDSQRHEGWLALDDRYDDGGYSGGTLERPALQRLIRDIEAGRVDTVVCYKIDRLSRSLTDFAKLVDVFERNSVTFVSVTQSFCTTTSMGRLTLNILLSFAQFERELAGERIRDKFAASRRKRIFMGGHPPLGYDVRDRKLVVNPAEAELVRLIFRRFLDLGSALLLIRELNAQGHRTKSCTTHAGTFREGRPFDKGTLYKILCNRTYLGEAVHKCSSYPGEHEPMIDRATWERVHEVLATNAKRRGNEARARTPAPLRGLMRCTHCSSAMRRPAPSKILPSELAIRLPACSSTPSQRSLPVVSRTGLTKVVFISTVVKACPGSRVECTAQPMAESRRSASQPPWTNPMGL